MYDKKVIRYIYGQENLLVPWYLIASYAYYVKDNPIISDGLFDKICKDLLQHWDKVEHYHKYLVDKESLDAGTCLLKDDEHEYDEEGKTPVGYYPKRVKYIYESLTETKA